MSIGTSNQGKNPIIDDRGLAFVVYILYFVGYFTVITAIIGVIIAHLQAHSAGSEIKSHYTFQIRTFWIGLLYLIAGFILLYVVVGGFILLWWFVWSLVQFKKEYWLSIAASQ